MSQQKRTTREKVLTGIAVGLVALYILVKFLLLPVYQNWKDSELLISRLQAQYVKTVKMVRLATAQMESSQSTPPTSGVAPIAAFLKDIETTAGKEILIRRFQPLQTASGTGRTTTSGAKADIRSIQVQIDCIGTLPQLVRFFEQLESQHRLTRIRHFYLTPTGKGKRLQCQLIVARLLSV